MNNPSKIVTACLLVLGLALSLAPVAVAQTVTATLTGTVSDQSGALVPNAKVVATHRSTKIDYSAQSNDSGMYTIPFLPIGEYVVTAEISGFKKLVTNPIKLEVNQIARVDLKLELGEVTQVVDVLGVAPVLQTESTTVGQVISGETTVSLPLNGRNFSQLTLLVPGAVAPNMRGFNGAESNASARPYVNGNREQGNAFLLDGVSVDETIDNRIGYRPNVDAIAEFKVETNNSSAEFGNVTGAITNMSIKSGTNEFHGNVFEFFRNDAMDANRWENNKARAPKQKLRLNIFGGTVGGPIVKDKLFFFGAYQETRQRTGGASSISVAPVEWRRGDLSSISTVIRDPLTGQPFPNNQIPVARFSPIARTLLSDTTLYPLPTRSGTNVTNNYGTATADAVDNRQFDAKIDAKLSNADSIWGRYSAGFLDGGDGFRGTLPATIGTLRTQRPQNFVLTWNRTLSPNTVNEARIGFNRATFVSDYNDWAGIGNANAKIGIGGSQAIPGLSGLRLGQGLTEVGTAFTNERNYTNTFHYGDNLSMARGKHFLKMGGQWQRYQQNRYYPGNNGLLGYFSYSAGFSFTGSQFADFLLDQVSQKGIGSLSGTWGHRQNRIGLFFQDDFKVKTNLTLNLGMRWEYTSPVVEVKDRQSNFDIVTGRQLFANVDGNSRALYDPFYKGFEPRIGFAWTAANKLVVRAGYGITQYMEGTGSNLRLPLNPPFFSEADRAYDASSGPGTATTGFTDVIVRSEPAGLIRIWDPKLRPQFTQQYNLTLEYQLDSKTSLTAGYVGHKATHLVDPRDWNQPLPGTGPTSTWKPLDQRRPLYSARPLVTAVSGTDSSATSDYNSLQVSARRRFSQGLEFLASYTLSKTLTDNLGYYGSGGVAAQSAYWANAYDRRSDRGLSFFDATHNFVWSGTYDLPIGKGRAFGNGWTGVTNALLGGWNISSIISLHTGFPINIRANDVSLQAPRGAGRPNRIPGRTAQLDSPTPDRWLDISAFELPAQGTFGNSFTSSERAPGFGNWDFAVGKKFNMTESRYFDFRAEFFNATNHPSYGPPGANISAPNAFGIVTATINEPRILEFALKFHF